MPQTVAVNIAPWVAILISLAGLLVLVSQAYILPAVRAGRADRKKILDAIVSTAERDAAQDRKIERLEVDRTDHGSRISTLERLINERTEATQNTLLVAAENLERVNQTASRVEQTVNGKTEALRTEIAMLKQNLQDMKNIVRRRKNRGR